MNDPDFDDLYRCYHHRVYTYMRQHTLQPGDSDEVAQDLSSKVWVRAIEAVKRGSGPRDCAVGWLFTIARHLLYDYYRSRSHVPNFIRLDSLAYDFDESDGTRDKGDILATDTDAPHEVAARAILRQQVQHAIDGLTGAQPYVTRARMAGYEYGEIAATLGKSAGAAKQLQTRANAQLRLRLQEVQ